MIKKLTEKVYSLINTGTAKDTAVVFSGNVMTAFLGFLFTIVIARMLSVSDFGIFSAASNLIIILTSLSDLGLSSGVVAFMSPYLSKGDEKKANEYAKAAFVVKVIVSLTLSLLIVLFAGFVSKNWLATMDKRVAYWVAVISFLFIADTFLPFILQAKKLFLKSVLIDISVSLPKVAIPYIFVKMGILNLSSIFWAFSLSVSISVVVGFAFTGIKFLLSKPKIEVYKDLAKYSGWLGVNRIISSISGKIDVQMLASMMGAVATGFYSIPSRLASFLIVLSSSFSAVLAPRFSGFRSKKDEWKYLIKSTLVTFGMVILTIIWIIVGKPFILILFGQKYLPSVPIFQALCVSTIPYLLAVPSVTAIIYGMKKTIYIGMFSFFQIATIFILNFLLIPKYGPFGPTIAFGVVYTILAIYSWIIVINYYKQND